MGEATTHRALDGSHVRFESDPAGDRPATCCSVFDIGESPIEVTAGNRHFARRAVAAALGPIRYDEAYDVFGGVVHVGRLERHGDGNPPLVGVWEGARSSFYLHIYRSSTGGLLRLLSLLRVVEYADGLEVTRGPAALLTGLGRELPTHPTCVMKAVEGTAVVETTRMTRDRSRLLPRWKGTRVRGGELFADRRADGRTSFVIANDTSFTSVVPESERETEATLGVVEDLRVDWEE